MSDPPKLLSGSEFLRARPAALASVGVCLGLLLVVSSDPKDLMAQETKKTFSGHLDAVVMGVFAPSRTEIATASFDQTARVWDLETGRELRQYTQHTGPLYCLAVSGDGKSLVTGSQDNTLRAWDMPVRKPLQSYADHTKRANALSISSDWLVSVSAEPSVRIRPITTAVPQASPRVGHTSNVLAVDVRNDGAYFATADEQGRILIWSPYLDEPQGELAGFAGPVRQLRFVPNNQQLLSASDDGIVRVWQLLPTAPLKFELGETLIDWSLVTGQPLAICVAEGGRAFALNLTTGAVATEFPKLEFTATSVQNAPNNNWVAIADSAGKVHLRNMNDGSAKATVACHAGRIHEVAIHPDSIRFATCSEDGTVQLWGQPAAGEEAPKPQQTWKMSDSQIVPATAIVFSADQQHLFAGGSDGKIRQWNLSNKALVRTIDAFSKPDSLAVRELLITPNSQSLVAVGSDKTVRSWTLSDGAVLSVIDQSVPAMRISISPDSARVASSASDGTVRIWELATGMLLQSFAGHAGDVLGVAYQGDGQSVVSVGRDKTLRNFKTAIASAYPVHKGAISGMSLFAGGGQILSFGDDGRVVLANLAGGAELRSFRVPDAPAQTAADGAAVPPVFKKIRPTAVAGRIDNQRVAVGTQDGDVFVWNAGAGDIPLQHFKLDAPVTALAYSPDTQKLAVATAASSVHVYGPSLPNVQPAIELTPHQTIATDSLVSDLLYAPDSQAVWTASVNGKVDQWSYSSPAQRRQMNHGGPVYGVAISANGNTVVSCSADQTVRVWDNVTGAQKFQLDGHLGPVHAIAMSRDETFAVSSGADGTLRLWDIIGGRQLKQLAKYEQTMYSITLHPNGQLVAAAGADRRVHLLDIITGEERKLLEGHSDYIHCVAFDPPGAKLISYGYAGHLKVWNTADGSLMHQSRVGKVGNYAQFSPDGTKILLSNGDGTANVILSP